MSSRRRSRLACNRENSLQSGQTRPRRPKGSNKTPKAHSSIESCPARRGPGPQLISARIVAQDGEDSLLAARPGYTSTPPSYGCVYPLRWGCPSIPVVKVLATSPPSRVSRAARRRRLSRRRRSLSRRRRGGSPCREVSRGVAGCRGRVRRRLSRRRRDLSRRRRDLSRRRRGRVATRRAAVAVCRGVSRVSRGCRGPSFFCQNRDMYLDTHQRGVCQQAPRSTSYLFARRAAQNARVVQLAREASWSLPFNTLFCKIGGVPVRQAGGSHARARQAGVRACVPCLGACVDGCRMDGWMDGADLKFLSVFRLLRAQVATY